MILRGCSIFTIDSIIGVLSFIILLGQSNTLCAFEKPYNNQFNSVTKSTNAVVIMKKEPLPSDDLQ